MRVVVQRVSRARVTVGNEIVGEIGQGLLILLGVTHGDTIDDARWLAEKTIGLRIFADDEGKRQLSVAENARKPFVARFLKIGEVHRVVDVPEVVEVARADLDPLLVHYVSALRRRRGSRAAR